MKTLNRLVLLSALCYSTASVSAQIVLQWDSSPWNPSSPAGPFDYSVTVSGGTHTGSVWPDRYHGTITSATGIDPASIGTGTGIPEGLFTYCYELTQYFYPSESVTYDVVPGATGINPYTLQFIGAVNSQLGTGIYGWLNPTNANMAAAVQLGIWETLYDVGNPFDLSSGVNHGNFYLSNIASLGSDPGSVGYYLGLFSGAMSGSSAVPASSVVLLSNTSDPNQNGAGAQDQITAVRVPARQTVPEPGTLLLAGLGIAMAIGRKRGMQRAIEAGPPGSSGSNRFRFR
ncbi:MAG: PEP-CTERM sorting domain-containing protein [Pseudomonadota bacterium]|nr:PEP-CTERM sorting domain-containing protein [Pseudomonadota bacterium]